MTVAFSGALLKVVPKAVARAHAGGTVGAMSDILQLVQPRLVNSQSLVSKGGEASTLPPGSTAVWRTESQAAVVMVRGPGGNVTLDRRAQELPSQPKVSPQSSHARPWVVATTTKRLRRRS